MAKTRDEINPYSPLPPLIRRDPKELTPEQQKEREEWIKQYNERRRILLQDQDVEEEYEQKAIQEKRQELKHMIETDPLAKGAEIRYLDGVPFLYKENLTIENIKKAFPGVKIKKVETPKGTITITKDNEHLFIPFLEQEHLVKELIKQNEQLKNALKKNIKKNR